jgi:hypothetical protein
MSLWLIEASANIVMEEENREVFARPPDVVDYLIYSLNKGFLDYWSWLHTVRHVLLSYCTSHRELVDDMQEQWSHT